MFCLSDDPAQEDADVYFCPFNSMLRLLTGGNAQQQKRNVLYDNSGLGVGDVSGVLLFCRGVFVCQATEILDLPGLEQFKNLKKVVNNFSLIVNGDFDLTQERTSLESQERVRLYR